MAAILNFQIFAQNGKIQISLMLIDFEKAFDSISWKFIYKVLDIFGFPQSYIKWVKLLNTSIVGAVVQAGVKSEFLKIERGCKQGDPIAPYLSILCGQILTYMIKDNNKIKGIYIGGHQFKITQFADDTTLFLNGTQNCLQAALNTLELFGSFSGLKMNTSKTKVIWIGRKMHMVEKLNVNSKLQWGTDRFNLLGIQFSVDLELIPSLNYNKAMDDACKLLNVWKKRNLIPFGKITIIKTFILSKFNHLFNSLPSPADNFVKKINSVLFSYLWENKPDKIKRSYVTLDYCKGGLQMIDLCSHIQSAKLMWMTRILQGRPSSWQLLFECNISPIFKLSKFGYGWCKCILKTIKNNFWKDVLQAWVGLCENLSIETSEQLLSSPIWYNPRISSTTLYYPKWFRHGIEAIGDVIDTNGILITEHKLKNKFNLPCINFLEMTRLKLLIKKYIQKCNIILQDFRRPNIPREVEIVNSHTKSKDFYKLINTRYPEIGIKHKWNEDLNLSIQPNDWKKIFKICFKTVKDNYLIWFQYRILHRILGTRKLLYNMNKSPSPNCLFCGDSPETLIHLFCQCPKVASFWAEVEDWVTSETTFPTNFTPSEIILGYLKDENFLPINVIIILTKNYIYTKSRTTTPLILRELKKTVQIVFEEQKYLANLQLKEECFYRNWALFKDILRT